MLKDKVRKVDYFGDLDYLSFVDNAIQVAIMRKEFLILEAPTNDARNSLAKHLRECIEFSSSRECDAHKFVFMF
jgi:hypothetical protein